MWWNMQQSFPTILKWTICWLHICFLVEFCFLELLEVDVDSVWLFVQCVPRGMRAKILQNLPFWWHPSCYKFLFAILFSHVGETTWTQILNQTLLLFTAKVMRVPNPFLPIFDLTPKSQPHDLTSKKNLPDFPSDNMIMFPMLCLYWLQFPAFWGLHLLYWVLTRGGRKFSFLIGQLSYMTLPTTSNVPS